MHRLPPDKTDKTILDEDGSLTWFGKRRKLWQNALKNTDRLKEDIKKLKNMNLTKRSIEIVRPFLPAEADLNNNFYVVLFGASNAFSVGNRNGFDLLQMARYDDGSLNVENITLIFAHELHHTGFASANNKNMGKIESEDKIFLAGAITAEGMATYFINKPHETPDEHWKKHLRNTDIYYKKAEEHIRKSLNGEVEKSKIVDYWLSGYVGKAYALGVDMFSVIEKYSGINAAINLARDYRKMLIIYNTAAKKGISAGEDLYLFDDALAKKILTIN